MGNTRLQIETADHGGPWEKADRPSEPSLWTCSPPGTASTLQPRDQKCKSKQNRGCWVERLRWKPRAAETVTLCGQHPGKQRLSWRAGSPHESSAGPWSACRVKSPQDHWKRHWESSGWKHLSAHTGLERLHFTARMERPPTTPVMSRVLEGPD